jgi:hypothetical protein
MYPFEFRLRKSRAAADWRPTVALNSRDNSFQSSGSHGLSS